MSPLVKTTVGLMGTPAYLAPEQIEGPRTVSAASDQYALGIILYQCVTGRPAFSSDDEVTKIFGDIVNGKRTPADELRCDLPEGFQRIIDRATSRDPAARFPSVRAMGKALLAYASPKAVLTWASTFSDREAPAGSRRWRRRRGGGRSGAGSPRRWWRGAGRRGDDRVGDAARAGAAHDRDAAAGDDAAGDAPTNRDPGGAGQRRACR